MSNGWNKRRGKNNSLPLIQQLFSLSRAMKRILATAVLLAVIVIAGHVVSSGLAAQTPPGVEPLGSLKKVSIPQPSNLGNYVQSKTAAIALGKSLFWDMQVGSDGITACASCHFHAGADSRAKNQLNPGLLRVNANGSPNPDQRVTKGGLNYTLQPGDYPFHKLADPNNRSSKVLADTNDVAASHGVFNAEFVGVVPGRPEDEVKYKPDPVFNIGGTNVRRVEPRNTSSVINSAYYFRGFWDGRAQDIFNGVNPLGLRDPDAKLYKATTPGQLAEVKVSLNNASLASQALGPPLSSLEQSAEGRTFREVRNASGQVDRASKSAATSKKLPRKLGKKLSTLRPLAKQLVHPQDSVLGAYSQTPVPGLKVSTYKNLVEAAFRPEWWNSDQIIRVNANGSRNIVKQREGSLAADDYTLLEYNFPLFFGLAMQLYESTLVSNDTPFDQYMNGNSSALTAQQKQGLKIFQAPFNQGGAGCIFCHAGPELTTASTTNVRKHGRLSRIPIPGSPIQDTGFFNIGVRPPLEDLGVGASDGLKQSRPLSEARLAQQKSFKSVFRQDPNIKVDAKSLVVADGLFKTPGLRNVELTAPYFHNGGQLTLRQVVDFYNRGGDFGGGLPVLNLKEEDKKALVAFLKGLTDERVRYQKAPFDHPQLFITNGHPGNQISAADDGTGKAKDINVKIPSVGRNGGAPLPNFLGVEQK